MNCSENESPRNVASQFWLGTSVKVHFPSKGYSGLFCAFPIFDETKVRSLFAVLATLTDFVIVDCTSDLKNPISKAAIKEILPDVSSGRGNLRKKGKLNN